MAVVKKSALVMHSPEKMFQLVDGINEYHKFLPWCEGSEELLRSEQQVEARIDINHSGFKHSFSTVNNNILFDSIEMTLLKGPFKYLTGTWSFEAIGDKAKPQGCKISLHLEFEFSSKLIGMTFGRVFEKLASTMVDSFTERANKIY